MHRLLLTLALTGMLAGPALANDLSGVPRIIDGDTLAIGSIKIRLVGIDAPEKHQTCKDAGGQKYDCGIVSAAALRAHIC
jgi:endonuclease YncB( thermonuclease family)